MKVQRLQDLITEKTGLSKQYLIYGGKKLEEGKALGDYPPLGHQATIFMMMRLPGGGCCTSSQRNDEVEEHVHEVEEVRQYKLRITDDPCMICLTDGAIKMPCGHSISPECLMDYCWNQIDLKKYEIRCPDLTCATEWPFSVLRRCEKVDEKELPLLAQALSKNYCDSPDKGITDCPRCNSYCTRQDPTKYSMQCIVCSREGNTYRFCFKCKQEWKNGSDEYSCGNIQCTSNEKDRQKILGRCPMIEIIGVSCPEIRECPFCKTLIKHDGHCKKVVCNRCRKSFCFVCLRGLTDDTSTEGVCGGGYVQCAVAPRQLM